MLGGGERDELPPLGIEDPAAAGIDPAELLDADPEPGSKTRRKSSASKATAAKQSRAGGKFTSRATVQKQMADELDSYAKLLALTWSMTDEHCAGALNQTSTDITRDLAALLARSDWVMEKWATTTLLGDLIKLGHSAYPFLRAVWDHHGRGRGRQQEQEETYDAVDVTDPGRYSPYRPAAYTG